MCTETYAYGIHGANVVINIPVFSLYEDIALSLGFRKASGLIRHCMTCMLTAV